MNSEKQTVNAYFHFLKTMGYVYQKHDMGFYLDSKDRKFSIIRMGELYNLYFYKKENNQLILVEQHSGMISMLLSIQWIFIRAK